MDLKTLELMKQVPRKKFTIGGRRLTLLQHWNSTDNKNYRYNIRIRLLKYLGYLR